jgi:hypothetical protein
MSQPNDPGPPPINPYDEHGGMSGTSKVLLGVGIGCGVLILLCCGTLGVATYVVSRVAQKATIKEPAQIEAIAADIVSMKVPEPLKPLVALDIVLPIVGPVAKGAAYSDESHQSFLALGQFNQSFSDRHNLEAQLRAGLGQQNDEDVEIQETFDLDSKINDEPASFVISKGIGKQSKEEIWEIRGEFHGKSGPALLIFKGKAATFSKDQLLDMLKSMQ